MNLHVIELPQLQGQRHVDGVNLHAIERTRFRVDVVSMA